MPDLSRYIELIKSGEVVAFPTETVYGLGADARNPSAIKKVFETKGRPADNPLIVHVSNIDQVNDFVAVTPDPAKKLIDEFWPGPLTIIFKKKPEVLDLITAGLDTVAIRMPDHSIALELIYATGPLVAPSANKSGRPSPTKADHVMSDFGNDFPVIVGGNTEVGLESTVIDLSSEFPTILRPGKIGTKEIESVLGTTVRDSTSGSEVESPKSPGQKYSHYKPIASVVYGNIEGIKEDTLYLLQSKSNKNSRNIVCYNGDLQLLSKELYDRFRQADHIGYRNIHIEPIEPYTKEYPSYYEALKNRISRALG
ncbi:MAG: L-threonylcarbamoyladenylate synthase [Gracilimonas sp.]